MTAVTDLKEKGEKDQSAKVKNLLHLFRRLLYTAEEKDSSDTYSLPLFRSRRTTHTHTRKGISISGVKAKAPKLNFAERVDGRVEECCGRPMLFSPPPHPQFFFASAVQTRWEQQAENGLEKKRRRRRRRGGPSVVMSFPPSFPLPRPLWRSSHLKFMRGGGGVSFLFYPHSKVGRSGEEKKIWAAGCSAGIFSQRRSWPRKRENRPGPVNPSPPKTRLEMPIPGPSSYRMR